MIYLDTNIFFYYLDEESPQHLICINFLDNAVRKRIPIVTSAETTQEIIHYYRSIKKDAIGLAACKYLLKVIPEPLIITNEVINQFLKLVPKYERPESRDLLHLATCIFYKIKSVITFDADFKKFSEVKAYLPSEIRLK